MTHDVWTVKGNLWAFIGGVVSFIDNDWTFVSRHLTLKRVAHHHKGAWLAEPLVTVLKKRDIYKKISTVLHYFTNIWKTKVLISSSLFYYMLAHSTDSASNNVTLAAEMHSQLQEHDVNVYSSEYTWDPETMHIKCMCHKIGLIVNAGIAALGLPIVQQRHSVLGYFPSPENLPPIPEDEEIDPEILIGSGELDSGPDDEHDEDDLSESEEPVVSESADDHWDMEPIDIIPRPTNTKVNGLKVLTQDVSFFKLRSK